MQSGCLDGKVKSKFEKHDLLTLYYCCPAKLLYSAGDHDQPRFYKYDVVRIHQMDNNEGYDGGQKRYRIYYVNKRIDARDPRYIIMWSID